MPKNRPPTKPPVQKPGKTQSVASFRSMALRMAKPTMLRIQEDVESLDEKGCRDHRPRLSAALPMPTPSRT
jgi:hypothetical protein